MENHEVTDPLALPFEIRASANRARMATLHAIRDGQPIRVATYRLGNAKRRNVVAAEWAADARLQNGAPLTADAIAQALEDREAKAAAQLYEQDVQPEPEPEPAPPTTAPAAPPDGCRTMTREDLVEMSRRQASGEKLRLRPFDATEQYLAERMVYRHGRDLRYTAAHGWLVWDGRRWRRDDTLEVERRAKETITSLYRDAADTADDDERRAIVNFAKASQCNARMNNVISLARSETGVAVRAEDFDADPWLLNCVNGTLDLRTAELRKADRTDLITKLAGTAFDPDAGCPVFLRFLDTTFAGDAAMIGFGKRALGSASSGFIREHALHVLYGTGANGKSTLINCMAGLLGDYAKTAAPKLLIRRDSDAHPTELADLHGVRFLATVETAEGGRLDEERVKQLTGGDRIKGRYMRQDFFEFPPTHTPFLATNHKPTIHGNDHAIWRRVFLWPFTVTIADAAQDADLPMKLRAEWPGILAWLVGGCLEWQKAGLGAPECVRVATKGYREESDVLGQFIEECCEVNVKWEAAAGHLYRAYSKWATDAGLRPLGNPGFSQRLQARPGITRTEKETGRIYTGLKLRAEWFNRIQPA